MAAWTRDWGQLLRGARQVAGLSLAGLAERTGLSPGYLSKLESGQDGARNPSRATLVALARALPSFRPLAYQLEPLDGSQQSVAFAQREESLAAPSSVVAAGEMAREAEAPIQLGWRELEALVAFLALDRSVSPVRLTARLIARAVDRPVEMVRQTLDLLIAVGALDARAPARPGDMPTYGRGPAFEERLGLVKLGDALILAAALLSQAAPARAPRERDGGGV
ncbi:MAG: helix-turn-helix domain-containing protein [Ktedonobacterales bacterium]